MFAKETSAIGAIEFLDAKWKPTGLPGELSNGARTRHTMVNQFLCAIAADRKSGSSWHRNMEKAIDWALPMNLTECLRPSYADSIGKRIQVT